MSIPDRTDKDGSGVDASNNGLYRQYLPDLSQERFTTMQKQDAHAYAKSFKERGAPPWLHALYIHWLELLKEPFRGITNDGNIRPGIYQLEDEGIPINSIVEATESVLKQLNNEQRSTIAYHIDSPEWRTWSNPEFLLSNKGIRLDEVSTSVRDAVMHVLQTTLSPEGYQKAVDAMRVNGYLGHIVESPAICNEYSYNFVLFGTPSNSRPWGYSFYGHHLCLNIFFYRSQIVISPWFTGAEPNEIDSGPYKGTTLLTTEDKLGLQLMQSLDSDQQNKAQIYKQMKDPAMPTGRWNHDDQRHLCGAYRDNRVVPYEGILISEMKDEQKDLVLGILEQYLLYLPETSRKIKIDHIQSWFQETYFSWIGGYTDEDVFYYRIQSPIILIEFDHHSGVFLNNTHPAKFHIHTLLRTPNGGDYGIALRPQIPGIEQKFIWEEGRD